MDYFEDLRNKLVMGNINQQEKIRGRRKNEGGGGSKDGKKQSFLNHLKQNFTAKVFFDPGTDEKKLRKFSPRKLIINLIGSNTDTNLTE